MLHGRSAFTTGFLAAAAAFGAAESKVRPHPRVFITAADLPRLRRLANDHRSGPFRVVPAEGWEKVRRRAEQFVKASPYHYRVMMPGRNGGPSREWEYTLSDAPPPRHDDFRHYPPWTAMFQERDDSITTRLKYLLVAGMVTGEDRFFDRARKIVRHLCAWPGVWTDPSYGSGRPCLDTGHAAVWVGVYYDWAGSRLPAREAAEVRNALAEKALAPIDAVIDSLPAYHNYNAVVAAGLGIGGIALLGEDHRAEGWVRHAVARARAWLDAQGRDGGFMEGPMYGTYAADQIGDLLRALETAGVPHDLTDHPVLRTLPRYAVSLLDMGSRKQPCFGDGGLTVGFSNLMRVLALRGDRVAAWYSLQINALIPDTPRRLLDYDSDRIRPERPAFNPSACWIDVGYAVLRNGFDPDAPMLAFKAGPPKAIIGHNHYDQNSFILMFGGKQAAADPGYRDYFRSKRRRYTVSSFGHNTVVLDVNDAYLASNAVCTAGHDQVRLNGGRIEEFFAGDPVDYVTGEAAPAYNPDDRRVLEHFQRRIWYAKPFAYIVEDHIEAPKPHRYSFLLHGEPGARIETQPDGCTIRTAGVLLDCRVYTPGSVEVKSGLYPGAEDRGPWFAAATRRPAKSARFVAVLVPRYDRQVVINPGFEDGMIGWQPRRLPGFAENHVIDREVFHSGRASARIDNGGYYYSSRFRVRPGMRLTARWWARCTASEGASSLFYFWHKGRAVATAKGPAADSDEWRPYEFTAEVPKGVEEACLALQFFGKGRCWYDDVDIVVDPPLPSSQPPRVMALGADAEAGMEIHVGDLCAVFLRNDSGRPRRIEAAGRSFETTAPRALIVIDGKGRAVAFAPGGEVRIDGRVLPAASGEWRRRKQ